MKKTGIIFAAAIGLAASAFAENIIALGSQTRDITITQDSILTGTLSGTPRPKISIAHGVRVKLSGATITGDYSRDPRHVDDWAGLTCLGSATIVLEGENHVTGCNSRPAIYVPENYTLAIEGSGSLEATGGNNGTVGGAGIGADNWLPCGDIVINGGTITAKGYGSCAGIGGAYRYRCGYITINGGDVTASSASGAGIGTGGYVAGDDDDEEGGDCGHITITGGKVTASGAAGAAAIGTGRGGTCGNIEIYGGNVVARGTAGGAGIGSGRSGVCGTITIDGGVVSATSLASRSTYDTSNAMFCGAAIGAGDYGSCGTVEVKGGIVSATGDSGAAAIGAGIHGSCPRVYVRSGISRVTVEKGTGSGSAWLGRGKESPVGCYVVVEIDDLVLAEDGRTRVYTWNGDLSTRSGDAIAFNGMRLYGTLAENCKVSIEEDACVTLDGITINGANSSSCRWAGLTCLGNAELQLAEGSANTIRGFYQDYPGIYVPEGSRLTITGPGSLTASSNGRGAGIGGGYQMHCGSIDLSGGVVTATGGTGCAGIGGGQSARSGSINIYSGITRVVATGGSSAAPIGIGNGGAGSMPYVADGLSSVTSGNTRTITPTWDGNLTTLANYAVAYDGMTITGSLRTKNKITIAAGATVTLKNMTIMVDGVEEDTDCKWAGLTCAGDATLILEGNNDVRGFYKDYPGIYVPVGSTLTIKGSGWLEADSNGYGAGIGGGWGISCGNIDIKSGYVDATGGPGAAGIGGGGGSGITCGNIHIYSGVARVRAYCAEGYVPIGPGSSGLGGATTVDPGTKDTTSDDDLSRTITWGGDLSLVTGDVTAVSGTVIHGTLDYPCKVSIGVGATVTLSNAVVNGVNYYSSQYAGITCEGNATIRLKGKNVVRGFYLDYPGIYVPENKLLTIQGNGSLTAGSNGYGAGIGGGFQLPCGLIVIEGGNITASGGMSAAGIGGGYRAACGGIRIDSDITRVSATCGENCDNPIGKGQGGSGGSVTLSGELHETTSESTRLIYPMRVNLAVIESDFTAVDGMTLYGTLLGNYKVSIADGAEVTLSNVYINQCFDPDFFEEAGYESIPGITCLGDAIINLKGENLVTASNGNDPGIYIPMGSTLTIRGDDEHDSLDAVAGQGGRAAGIGGRGDYYSYGHNNNCGSIVIEGGLIIASGAEIGGAGIGSGFEGHYDSIKITGGIVEAYGGFNAAGIGGGEDDTLNGEILITGGIIIAEGGAYAPGIGSGADGSCGNITIGAGVTWVVAKRGSNDVQPIGAGRDGSCGAVTVAQELHDVTDVNGVRTIWPVPWDGNLDTLTGYGYVTATNNVTIRGTLSADQKICVSSGATVTLSDVTINGGDKSDCKWAGITCYGDATLVLVGKNTVKGFYGTYPGIYVPPGSTLTITGSGSLDASSNGYAAGIGGGESLSCGNIVFRGGDVSASGGLGAAGIGGGASARCGDIVVEKTAGRVVGWRGKQCENNIGAGYGGLGGATTVEPGLTDVTSSNGGMRRIQWDGDLDALDFNAIAYNGTFIHGTLGEKCQVSIADGARVILSNATINVSDVNSTSYEWAGLTCIGNATIVLRGSNVVKGFYNVHPGIYVPAGSTLTIKGDGSLTASSNGWGAGIGGGKDIGCGNISILGGTITATGGNYCAGIGGGYNGTDSGVCGNIYIGAGITRIRATRGEYCETPIGQGGYSGTTNNVTLARGLIDDRGNWRRTIESWWDGNLANVTDDMDVPDGMTLYGTLGGEYKLTIEDGATVTLRDADINGIGDFAGTWAGLTCTGEATLVLEGEGENVVRGFGDDYPGIYVPEGASLFIEGDGELTAYGGSKAAGIGAGRNLACGGIQILGGTIYAYGENASAGIGGTGTGDCEYILIGGGKVYAYGGSGGAGIGGGGSGACGQIMISDAEVFARGAGTIGAAGIGTGTGGTCGPIWIDEGSEVTAFGARWGAGIGAGYNGTSDYIMICGGYVTATGGEDAAGIGGGKKATCFDVNILLGIECVAATCGGECVPIGAGVGGDQRRPNNINDGLIDNTSADGKTRTLRGWNGDLAALTGDIVVPDGMTIYGTLEGKYKVSIARNASVTISNVTIEVSGVRTSSSYSWAGLNCIGNAEITLVGSTTIRGFYENEPGIFVPTNKTLTIKGDGELTAYSNGYGAGIGGGFDVSCGNITIAGGTIYAYGDGSAAGIGAGMNSDCGTISIVGGNVTAEGGRYAAGIGAGQAGNCDEVYIGAGIERVEATYGDYGEESIGAGRNSTCYNYPTIPAGLIDETSGSTRTIYRWNGDLSELTDDITIPSGMTVYGTLQGNYKVSIDSNARVTLSNATIQIANVGTDTSCKWAGLTCKLGATITLVGNNTIQGFYQDYPGIYVPEGCRLTIKGNGSLTACGSAGSQSKRWAPGIGSGYHIDCGDISIQSGTITAIGGHYAAGIGSGSQAACGDISITGGSITATGGDYGAGIGAGYMGTCNSISIGPGIVRVEATHGDTNNEGPAYAIGAGVYGTLNSEGPEIDTSLLDDNGDPTRTITSASAVDPLAAYKRWARENGVSGAWDYVDANGIANVFRYAFNRPTGDFQMILDIAFDEYGYAVILTQPLVNDGGFTFTIVASANPDGTGVVVEHGLDPSGVTVIGETPSDKRFFRLKAVVQ